MFGLGFTEIAFLLILAGIVWVLVKRDKIRRQQAAKNGREGNDDADTLQACPVCGIYVAPHAAQACARRDCPFATSGSG